MDRGNEYWGGFAAKCAECGIGDGAARKCAEGIDKNAYLGHETLLALGRKVPAFARRWLNMDARTPHQWVLPGWALSGGKSTARNVDDDMAIHLSRFLKDPKKYTGDARILSPSARLNLPSGKQVMAPAPMGMEDKWTEYKTLKKFMPKAMLMGRLLGKGVDPDIVSALNRKFGDRRWIVKERGGYGASPGAVLTPGNVSKMFLVPGTRNVQFNLARGGRKIRPIKELLVQEKRDIAAPWWQRLGDRLLKPFNLEEQFGDAFSRGTNEFRVHVQGGNVIPHATVHRGTLTGLGANYLAPWLPSTGRKAERFAAEVASSLPKRLKKSLMGMDIGIDRTTGRPFLIEGNFSTREGMSGIALDSPFMNRIRAYYEGRTPEDVVAKRLLWGLGSGTAAAGAGAAYAMSGDGK